jgi:hypothetical protein
MQLQVCCVSWWLWTVEAVHYQRYIGVLLWFAFFHAIPIVCNILDCKCSLVLWTFVVGRWGREYFSTLRLNGENRGCTFIVKSTAWNILDSIFKEQGRLAGRLVWRTMLLYRLATLLSLVAVKQEHFTLASIESVVSLILLVLWQRVMRIVTKKTSRRNVQLTWRPCCDSNSMSVLSQCFCVLIDNSIAVGHLKCAYVATYCREIWFQVGCLVHC